MRRRLFLLGAAALPLGACAGGTSVWAPDEALAVARFPNPGPTSLSLITVRNEHNGSGEHTALLIAAAERAMFDPFGGWTDPYVPERDDVLFGLSDDALERYLAYQASDGFFYVAQEKAVPPEVAETALARARAHGPVGVAQCVRAVGAVLEDLPGFEEIGRPWTPDAMARRFARLPGVVTTERHGPDVVPA
jgi:hypothetical protein